MSIINAYGQQNVIKRNGVNNTVYAVKDNLLGNFYNIENVPIIETNGGAYHWGLTGMVVSKKSTILHKWCTPRNSANTYVWSVENEFIEDAQTKQKFYIEKSDIGIGTTNGFKVKSNKAFMFVEWYPPLPSSVKVINIYNGTQYIVKQLRIK